MRSWEASPGRMRSVTRPRSGVLALVVSALVFSGCFKRYPQVDVYSEGPVEVYLRSEARGFASVEKDFAHPLSIAPVRLAHILSRLEVAPRRGDKERLTAIPTDLIFPVSEGVSDALARANPDQEVVVRVRRDTKHWGVFSHDYLTSLVVYARNESLYVHMSHHDWEIPRRRDERIPEPYVGFHPQRFEVIPGIAMARVDTQSVAIDWRNPIFDRPSTVQVLPTGEVVRKTILLESPPEAEDDVPETFDVPEGITPEQLRALADLEEARRAGAITESQYRARRRDILERPAP